MATILVVDDHPMNRDFLVSLLSYQKHRLLEAADGVQALIIMRKEKIDLVISDILMPNLDGYNLVQTMRAEPLFASIPVIFYTATYNKIEAKLIANGCGVGIVINKPAEPSVILNHVNTILGLPLFDQAICTDVVDFKEKYRTDLGENLSLFLAELDSTNHYLNTLAQTGKPLIENEDVFQQITTQVKKLQSNSQKMSSLIKLGFNLITERDPLRIFKIFSSAACTIMESYSATVGIIEDPENAVGRFCTTTQFPDVESHYSQTSKLTRIFLESIITKQQSVRLTELTEEQILDNQEITASPNRAFLAIPLLLAMQKRGVFYLVGKQNGEEFSDEDEQIATTMAAELAVLYGNILLYDSVQQHAVELQMEIAERKKIENELRQSEERLNLAMEAGLMNGWELDINTNTVSEFGYIDPLSKQTRGASSGSFETFLQRVLPEDRNRVTSALSYAIENDTYFNSEFRTKLDDGSIQWIGARGQLFKDENNTAQRVVGIGAIITERKKVEELARHHQSELAHITRVNSMGEIASSLAHEINQPLTVINTYVGTCIRRLETNPDDHESIIFAMKKVAQNVDHASEIIHRMRNFVRKGEINYERITINEVVNEAVSSIQDEKPNVAIDIHCEFAENLPLIEMDKIQIGQVLLNLMRNGIEAMLEKKTMQPKLLIQITQSDSYAIAINVRDFGPGFPDALREKLFTPYITTKAHGMGIGLAICRTIIEAHGGNITADNLPEGGANFQFTLPVNRHEHSE